MSDADDDLDEEGQGDETGTSFGGYDFSGLTSGEAEEPTSFPWFTWLSIIACVAIFIGLMQRDDLDSWEALARFGYLPANEVWRGGYWALVTSAFVHMEFLHALFNIYWLWVLGTRLERAIGSWRFLAFYLVAAFVSSSFQLSTSDSTGIGASGVVYGIFGFMWFARHRYPSFNEVLDSRTIGIFVLWLFGCIVATVLKVWEVGNAAHVSGLVFGVAVAAAFVLRYKTKLVLAGMSAMLVMSIVPLFWCPWSLTWLSNQAFDAHIAEDYEVALRRYTQIIEREPDNAWAHLNRSMVYEELGEADKAEADLQRAQELDPSIESGE